jgi:integrase
MESKRMVRLVPESGHTEKERMKDWIKISDNMVLFEPTGVYYARKYRRGKGRFFKSTGERRKAVAQSKANEMISEWLTGMRAAVGRHATVGEVSDELMRVLREAKEKGDRAETTWTHDKVYLRRICKLFGDFPVASMDESFWEDWIRKSGRKSGHKLGDLAKYVSKVLTFAYERKLIDRKPKIRNPDERETEFKTYTNEQVKALMDAADPEMRDIIILAAECGVRPYEARRLQWNMVDVRKSEIVIQLPKWFTKTRRYREFVVGPRSAEMLRRRAVVRVHGPFVFPSDSNETKPINEMTFSKHWRKTVERAGLPKGSKFHWLRHTFFTRALLEAKKDLPKVAAYGGNSPKLLFDRYMAKEAERTQDVAGSVTLE